MNLRSQPAQQILVERMQLPGSHPHLDRVSQRFRGLHEITRVCRFDETIQCCDRLGRPPHGDLIFR
jgi:hypothetical protein